MHFSLLNFLKYKAGQLSAYYESQIFHNGIEMQPEV